MHALSKGIFSFFWQSVDGYLQKLTGIDLLQFLSFIGGDLFCPLWIRVNILKPYYAGSCDVLSKYVFTQVQLSLLKFF